MAKPILTSDYPPPKYLVQPQEEDKIFFWLEEEQKKNLLHFIPWFKSQVKRKTTTLSLGEK